MSQIAYIKIGRNTKNHGAMLAALGYNVSTVAGHFAIEHEGLLTGNLDLTDHEVAMEKLKNVVKAKQLFSYTISIKAVNGKGDTGTYPGIHGCSYLNWVIPGLSCLVAKATMKTSSAKAATFSIEDILAD